MKWSKKVKAILSAPGRKIAEVKNNTLAMSDFMLAQIQKPVESQYRLLNEKVDCAVRECEIGIIGDGSKDFFERKILRGFFSPVERGDDEKMKSALRLIVDNWEEGVVQKSDGVWLRETFVPFLELCRQKDLKAIGRDKVQGLIFGKVGGKADVGSEKEGEPEQ